MNNYLMVNVDIKLDRKFCSKNLMDSIIFFLPFFWKINQINRQAEKQTSLSRI